LPIHTLCSTYPRERYQRTRRLVVGEHVEPEPVEAHPGRGLLKPSQGCRPKPRLRRAPADQRNCSRSIRAVVDRRIDMRTFLSLTSRAPLAPGAGEEACTQRGSLEDPPPLSHHIIRGALWPRCSRSPSPSRASPWWPALSSAPHERSLRSHPLPHPPGTLRQPRCWAGVAWSSPTRPPTSGSVVATVEGSSARDRRIVRPGSKWWGSTSRDCRPLGPIRG